MTRITDIKEATKLAQLAAVIASGLVSQPDFYASPEDMGDQRRETQEISIADQAVSLAARILDLAYEEYTGDAPEVGA
jgi:hypothetical protein